MSIKPPRKNRTETLIGPSNYLNIAQGNRVPVEKATNVINTLIQNKVIKGEKTDNVRDNVKVQDETTQGETKVQQIADDLTNKQDEAFFAK